MHILLATLDVHFLLDETKQCLCDQIGQQLRVLFRLIANNSQFRRHLLF